MYTDNLSTAKDTINSAFGAAHILSHRNYLKNAVTSGYESGGSWYDSTVELMTERNVYGGPVFANFLSGTAYANNFTVEKSQYPLFAFRPELISNHRYFWLRDVATSADFCSVLYSSRAEHDASNADGLGVRPAFCIKG